MLSLRVVCQCGLEYHVSEIGRKHVWAPFTSGVCSLYIPDVTKELLQSLVNVLGETKERLTVFSIHNTALGGPLLPFVCEALKLLDGLTCFILDDTGLREGLTTLLPNGLLYNGPKTLTCLSLENCFLTESSLQALAGAIDDEMLPALTHLNLSSNPLMPTYLLRSCMNLKRLQKLNFAKTRIDEHLNELSDYDRGFFHLVELDITNSFTSTEQFQPFAKLVRSPFLERVETKKNCSIQLPSHTLESLPVWHEALELALSYGASIEAQATNIAWITRSQAPIQGMMLACACSKF